MAKSTASDVTRSLEEWRGGDDSALDRLIPQIYSELRRLAERYLRREREDHTFQTHDLIHEAFLRLIDQRHIDWRNRAHFFAIAAQMMRRILVDHARRRRYGKHGGALRKVAFEDIPELALQSDTDVVALDDALAELSKIDETLVRVVDLRFFGGMDHEEIAAVLGLSKPTVQRRWRTAKAWLYQRLHPELAEGQHGHR